MCGAIDPFSDSFYDDFQGLNKPIKVECKKHGEFIINAGKHLNGEGCPICKKSKTKADEEGYDRSTKNLTDSHYEKRPNYKKNSDTFQSKWHKFGFV